jgi:hypothetical protein
MGPVPTAALVRIGFLAMLAIGCATANVRPNARFQAQHAYVYGRFMIVGQSMAFIIKCRDGATYKISFVAQDKVQMIELVPSVCQVDEVQYGSAGGPTGLAGFRLLQNEFLDPGGVYYVGDFNASGTYDVAYKVFYNEIHSTWRLKHARNEYERTTAEMRRMFPGFASVVTQNRIAHW